MNTIKKTARIAGLFYLTALISAGFAYFVRDSLVVHGDAASTAVKIMASENLFRLLLKGASTGKTPSWWER